MKDKILYKNLTPIFDSIYADNSFISTKLINIASQLNFSDGLNVDDISNFYKELKGNRMAESLLRLLVMNHLYMFDIVFSKRQSICSKLGIVDEKISQQALLDKRLKIF
ncbi:MAG: hypothetical protein M0T82_16220 [Desulfobacteraceae bacterium]|nr:hypothetical protein [Desulfobacteraceae bacterium]